ncbi:hypothetical protein R3P38DRAFT_2982486 [Favolaschia claudopus]|uniref:C2H2-type domain-containing protein n=1 Tax=Favolaschia claudopus TaxID=2862362 RepID=A0AAW0AZS5_9AGAR
MNAEAVRAQAVRARDALFTVALGAPPEDETEDEETEEEEYPARIHASTPRLVHPRPVDTQHPDMHKLIARIGSAREPALHRLLLKLSDASSKFSYATARTGIQAHVRTLVREHPHVSVDSITPRIVEEHGLFITCPFSADGCTAVFLAERSAAEAHFRQEHPPHSIVSAQAPAPADVIRTRSRARREGTSTAVDRVQCPICGARMNFDSLGRHFVQSHKPTKRTTRTAYACKLCDGEVFTIQEHVAHFGECQEEHFAQWDGNARAGKRRRIDTTDTDEAAA